MLGHDGPPTAIWRENLITDAPLERCPVRTLQLAREANPTLSAEVERYAERYYPAYRDHGALLVDGGLSDQPSRFLDMMAVIADIAATVDEKFVELTREPEP